MEDLMAKQDSTSASTSGKDNNVQQLRDQRAQETDTAKAADLDRRIAEAEKSQGGTAAR
jgi:hypothetical protein